MGQPYVFYRMGLVLGPIYTVLIAIICQISSNMYLNVKDLTPRKPESVYEIAFALFGRPSIFVVTLTIFMSVYGSIILYYMIIGDTVSTLMMSLMIDEPDNGGKPVDLDNYPWWVQLSTSKAFGILIMAASQLPMIFKRQLTEMKIVSYMLAAIVLTFVILVFSELMTDGNQVS